MNRTNIPISELLAMATTTNTPPGIGVYSPRYQDQDEYQAFLRTIRATPADDTARLILCDWLDEYATGCGNTEASERAAFIRLAVECQADYDRDMQTLGRPRPLPTPEGWRFSEKADRLIDWFQKDHNGKRVLESWCPLNGFYTLAGDHCDTQRNRENIRLTWSRGFVSTVRCTLAQFERHAGRIALEHPVTTWELTDAEPAENIYDGTGTSPERHWTLALTGERFRRESLPIDIIKAIGKIRGTDEGWDTTCLFFPTREAAIESLNAACVKVANERAEVLENQE